MTQPAPVPAPAEPPVPAPPAPAPTDPPTPVDPAVEMARLTAENKRLMAENARDRVAGKAAAAAEARAELLKQISGSDAPVDPAALQAQMQQRESESRALAAENNVLRLAPRAGADPDALVDSTTFMRDVAKLDPTAADYAVQLENLITTTVAANPKRYGSAVPGAPAPLPPPPAGDPANGGAGAPAPGSPTGVDAMRALLRPKRG